jgi:phosphoesterase RecJ-like protein
VGSNPSVGSKFNVLGYSSGQRGLTVNQLAFAYGGSNPSPSTIVLMNMTDSDIKKFDDLINSSDRILITTHVGPDPDAFSSLLLLGTTLEANFPQKLIVMSAEEQTGGLSSLAGYQNIKVQPLEQIINTADPNLIILVDSMNFKRCTRGDAQAVADLVKSKGIKLAIIDHHEQKDVQPNDVYINNGSPAAVQEVYELLFNNLGLKKPEGYAQTTMLGLYSDSGGFINQNPRYKESFNLAIDLIASGADLELVNNLINSHTLAEMKGLAELANNLASEQDYNYSFISDEFTQKWQSQGKAFEELKIGISNFVNIYIRNTNGRKWGFVVYKDLAASDSTYGVSLRAISGTKNVAEIASKLGGGGHIPAAGAKFEAGSIEEAINKVKEAISES